MTSKLPALHLYQLALESPQPPEGRFGKVAADRGEKLFDNKADCARCNVPPLLTEQGWNMHTPEEIGIDNFQANRGPEDRYRTSPLKGLWTHTKEDFTTMAALQHCIASLITMILYPDCYYLKVKKLI